MPLEPRAFSGARQPDRQHYRSLARARGNSRGGCSWCSWNGSNRRWCGGLRDGCLRSDLRRDLGHRRSNSRFVPGRLRSQWLLIVDSNHARHRRLGSRHTSSGSNARAGSWRRSSRRTFHSAAATPLPSTARRPTLVLHRLGERQFRNAARSQLEICLGLFFLRRTLLRRPLLGRPFPRRAFCQRTFSHGTWWRGSRSWLMQNGRFRLRRHCLGRHCLGSMLRGRVPSLCFKIFWLQRFGRVGCLLLGCLAALLAPLHTVAHPFAHIALVAQRPRWRQCAPLGTPDTRPASCQLRAPSSEQTTEGKSTRTPSHRWFPQRSSVYSDIYAFS